MLRFFKRKSKYLVFGCTENEVKSLLGSTDFKRILKGARREVITFPMQFMAGKTYNVYTFRSRQGNLMIVWLSLDDDAPVLY